MGSDGRSLPEVGADSIAATTSIPSTTFAKTGCWLRPVINAEHRADPDPERADLDLMVPIIRVFGEVVNEFLGRPFVAFQAVADFHIRIGDGPALEVVGLEKMPDIAKGGAVG